MLRLSRHVGDEGGPADQAEGLDERRQHAGDHGQADQGAVGVGELASRTASRGGKSTAESANTHQMTITLDPPARKRLSTSSVGRHSTSG